MLVSSLSYTTPDGRTLFSGINFSLSHQKMGFVGKNGVGKTTLLRILAGELQPTTGTITYTGTVGYLAQNITYSAEKTIADLFGVSDQLNALRRVAAGTHSESDLELVENFEIEKQLKEQLSKLNLGHIKLDQKILTLSGGELTRVRLAVLLRSSPDFLLLDEPTNNLDKESREFLYNWLKLYKKGLIIVSHDRELLMHVDQIVELSSLGTKLYGGNYAYYYEQREIEQEAHRRYLKDTKKAHRKAELDIRKSQERQQKRNKSGKRERAQGGQAKVILNAQKERSEQTGSSLSRTHERIINSAQQNLQEALSSTEFSAKLHIDFAQTHVPTGKLVLNLENITFGYTYARKLFNNFNLVVAGPERIAVHGRNGAGKSTLFKIIMGVLEPSSGSRRVGVEQILYLDQKLTLLAPHKTILENFQDISQRKTLSEIRNILAQFLFCNDDVFKKVEQLSGGEKLRLALACVFSSGHAPQLLLLDEPTNHLDFESIQVLEKTLTSYQGALIVISHDVQFLEAIGIDREVCLSI